MKKHLHNHTHHLLVLIETVSSGRTPDGRIVIRGPKTNLCHFTLAIICSSLVKSSLQARYKLTGLHQILGQNN